MHGRGLRRGKEDLWDREFPGGVCKHRADPEVDRESRQTSDNQALDVGRLNNTNTTNNNPISPISPDGIDSKDSSKPKKDRRETTIKSVFGGFVSSVNDLLSNQKKVEVSAPYNPVHLTHVGFNSNTGEFTGLPKEWQIRLQESGTTKVNGELQFDDVWQKFGHVAEADLHQPLKDPSGVVFQNPRSAPAPPPPSRPNLALCSQTTLPPTGLTSASSMSRRPSDSNGPVTSPVQLTSSKSFTGRPSKSKARPNSLDAPSIHAQPFPAKLNNTVAKDIPIPQRPAPPKPLSSSKLGKSSSTVIPINTTDHRAKQTTDDFAHHQLGGEVRFPFGEDEELGDYITGIGDLNNAFDGPSVQPQSTNLSTDHNPDHPDVTKPSNEQADQPPKPSLKSHKQDLNMRLRRFEPVPPSNHFSLISPFLDHLPHQPSFGFIDLIELLINFDHSIIPIVTIHLIPSLPITDPFDHTTDSQVILQHLSFVTSQSSDATNSTTMEDSLRLVASFSRQETYEEGTATVIEQLQAWDVRFQLSSLSTGFLSLESINDLCNHSIDPSSSAPPNLLRGPVGWVFNRVGHRKLLIDKESSSSSTEPIEHQSSSLIGVCKLIPQWRVREGCFLVFVEKRNRPTRLFKAADPLEGSEAVDDDDYDEQGEGEGDKGGEYECWVLDGHDLSTLAVKALPRLDQGELEQVSLSYHGIWACTLDQHGKVRASPLVRSIIESRLTTSLDYLPLLLRVPSRVRRRLLGGLRETMSSPPIIPSFATSASSSPIYIRRGFDFDPYLASSFSLSEGVPPDPPSPKLLRSLGEHVAQPLNFLFSDDKYNWPNLTKNVTLYHYVHLGFTYFFSLLLLRFLKITYLRFINTKPIFSLAHHSSVPLRTLIIENLPLHLQNDEALFEYFNDLLRFKVESVNVVRDVSGLVPLLSRRTKALINLEEAWAKWLGNPVRGEAALNYHPEEELARIVYHPRDDQTPNTDLTSSSNHNTSPRSPENPQDPTPFPVQPTLPHPSLKQLSTLPRPTFRPYWFSRKKVRLIDHLTAEFQQADDLVRRRRKGKFRCHSIGFVTFKIFMDAQTLCQVNHWPKPGQAIISLAPEPRDIYWPNLTIPQWSLKVRNAIALLSIAALYGFWATPVTFLANWMSYDTLVSLLSPKLIQWIEKSPTIKALIQNSLPTLAIIIFNALLPLLLDYQLTFF
ncbi:hypothetical protein PGTUg99_031676 [Puccinia graminis f. sp. tritici]|uniref:non-specific serine/threonine protein kinase n=1 Tax=Puccinia graminis f. sp. tritici TaxID=56615 RepID=A0A5B0REP4_PUCGR|nr:hypothetical protein PGTUg99_031676 [Puccinia graminis f. sp. tritici]